MYQLLSMVELSFFFWYFQCLWCLACAQATPIEFTNKAQKLESTQRSLDLNRTTGNAATRVSFFRVKVSFNYFSSAVLKPKKVPLKYWFQECSVPRLLI